MAISLCDLMVSDLFLYLHLESTYHIAQFAQIKEPNSSQNATNSKVDVGECVQ